MSNTLNINIKSVLVLDFDGVVCDSTDECLVTSWNAWEDFNNRNFFRTKINEFSYSEKLQFRPFRYYVRGAGEYYILRRLIAEKKTDSIDSFEDFNSLGKDWEEEVNEFKSFMFASREKLRNRSLDEWMGLHYIYSDMITIIKKSLEQGNIYIATLKDLDSVKFILEREGIFFPEDKIFHQGIIDTKLEALEQIQILERVDKSDIFFFDDVVNHLLDPFKSGFKSFQTTWGNVPKDYIMLANKKGIPLAKMNDLKDFYLK